MVENAEDAKDLPEKTEEVVEKVKKPAKEKAKKMSLTKEERVGIILLCGSRSLRQTAEDFNKANPEREKITHSCVSKVLAKFRETGSILDKPHVAKKRVTDETTSTYILAKFSMNPSSSIRRMALETNVSKTSIRRILRANHVVTLSTIGAANHHNHHHHNNNNNNAGASASSNNNHGDFQPANNGFSNGAPPGAKKKPARPRKSKAAIAAAAAAAAAASAPVVQVPNNNNNNNTNSANQQQQQVANKWQQHQQLQQQHQQQLHQQSSTSDGHNYGQMSGQMPDYGKEMNTNEYLVPVPAVLKSPKAHKVVAATSNWNAPPVGYGYGAPLLYPSAMGYIDPVPPQ